MSRTRLLCLWVAVLAALVISIAGFPVGLAAWLLPLIVYGSQPKQLLLGPRYLICGAQIVYFGNVARLSLQAAEGRLTIEPLQGKPLLIEREKFPTGARKAHKIKANKEAKFLKVAKKIAEKVRVASPEAEVQGLTHA